MPSLWVAAVLSLGLEARGVFAQTRAPFVIVGIGDSGTGIIKRMLQSFGLEMCNFQMCDAECRKKRDARKSKKGRQRVVAYNEGHGSQDDTYTRPVHKFIKALLRSSSGRVSQVSTYTQSKTFGSAVDAELKGSKRSFACIVEQRKAAGVGGGRAFPWGFKNPQHMYLMPVMDWAFNHSQRMLAVARDPRDICSGGNQNQFTKFRRWVVTAREPSRKGRNRHHTEQCFQFWANAWSDVLKEYGKDPRFRVVRIEDLVLPDPTKEGSAPRKTLECMMAHAELPPVTPTTALSWLASMHNHSYSYAGKSKSPKKKSRLESVSSAFGGNFQSTMQQLGYHKDRYELLAPAHSSVCA